MRPQHGLEHIPEALLRRHTTHEGKLAALALYPISDLARQFAYMAAGRNRLMQTPVNSILFVAALVMALILLSMLGVREQEASQLLAAASIALYAIAYVALSHCRFLAAALCATRCPPG